MTHPRQVARALAVAGLGCLLAGCISLLPKQKPAQLYRFGVSAPPVAPRLPEQERFSVAAASTGFEHAAAGDTILTITGDQAAYIAGSRWVTSAGTLFDAAVTRAFDVDGGAARLIPQGVAIRGDYGLKLDVRTFEVRYDHGSQAAPTVVVELYAGLIKRSSDLTAPTPAEHIFQVSVPASENRAGAIAEAFSAAVTKVLGEMVAWVDAKGA